MGNEKIVAALSAVHCHTLPHTLAFSRTVTHSRTLLSHIHTHTLAHSRTLTGFMLHVSGLSAVRLKP